MLSPNTEWIELIPAGTFSTNDGRGPFHNPEPQSVVRLSLQYMKMKGGLPIDCEHATDRAAPHGLPAPAMGWIRNFRIVAGAIQGRVEWTPRGSAALQAKRVQIRLAGVQLRATRWRARRCDDRAGDVDPARGADEQSGARSVARARGVAMVELSAMEKKIAEGTPAAAEMSEEDKKFCWLTGMSPAALMAAREKHRQTVLASRSEADYIRQTFGPARVTVAELCGGKK